MGKYAHLKGEISGLSRQALTRLREEGLPATPDYFQIFFEHYAGVNPALSRDIHALESIDETSLDVLYQRHFPAVDGQSLKLQEESQKMVALILERLSATLDQFGDDRQQKLESLKEQVSQGHVSLETAVHILGDEIGAVAREYGKMRSSLQESLHRMEALRQRYEELGQRARRDFLTGLLNRQVLEEMLQEICLGEHRHPLGLVAMDIDNFKEINDTYGHLCGDSVLKLFARKLGEYVRRDDLVFRFGGEEFIVILPQTNLAATYQLAEHIRRHIAEHVFHLEAGGQLSADISLRLTASFGAASHVAGESHESLLARADQAMYASKRAGRNRTTIAAHPEHP
ncbi:diguanylate cyclase [Desulfurispirillum indicum S5]|uniref:diguanylate cyclase n=1 Tax=Desulfurispirillum indicum (strain ATCC BAA-1389 / DSM 22839 / S5) TaxID=653733 RepID=E6W1Y3_DESIS|nr:GGDEF domain-containing protein [Desulfurispirillum indicum]ADU66609.1 diguanylate cyclase [Desulfurispirillum indicum S5]